jgi:capsular exopolysaccharide synthesis family protein
MADPINRSLLEGGQPAFSLAAGLTIIRKRKWMIAAIVLALPTVVGIVVSKQPKVYQASASIVIDANVPQYMGSNFRDVVDVDNSWLSEQELLQTDLKVMKSYSQAVAVAKALCNVKAEPDGETPLRRLVPGASCENPNDIARVAPLLQNLLVVVPSRESRVVNLMVDFGDPETAALLANTMAQVFITRNLEHRLSQSEGAATWLGDEYGDLVSQLNDAERQLIDFKKKNNVVSVGLEDQQNDLTSRRKRLADELNNIDVKLIGARAVREQYAQLQSNDPMADMTPGITDNPIIVRLKELYIDQYSRLLELRGKYLDKHPTVVAQETRLAAIKDDLSREAGLAAKSVESQYQTLVNQEKSLRTALDAATHESLQLEQRAIEFNRLKRNFDRLAKLSEQVGGRERETSLAGHLKTNNVRMLDAALVPVAPIAPNVTRSVSVAFVLALLISFALAFFLEVLDSTVKTQDDVEKSAGLVFLGLIPRILEEKQAGAKAPPALEQVAQSGSRDLYVLTHPKSAVAECCRAIRTNILFMTPDKPARSLLVTSAAPQEGKTTTAISLAITMAQSGLRVLLVDTDMRRPRLHKAFGIPPSPDGISRAILGDVQVAGMIRETGIANLFLLPCGALPPNPAELLHAERFKTIVQQLEDSFDRIIFDSPPVGAVTDASILARLTHGTVLVAKSGRTSKDTLSLLARRLLGEGGVNVLGCILNDLDITKQGNYGYYYYSRYGYYEGYDSTTSSTANPSASG